MKLQFLLFVLPFLALIAFVSLFIFKIFIVFGILKAPIAQKIVKWVFILMPLVLIATMTIGTKIYNSINAFFYVIAATWLPLLIYFFMGAVLLSIIYIIGVVSGHPINVFPLAITILIIIFGVTGYGIWNATKPRVVTYEIESPALSKAWSNKNIVLVSDTHLGIVRSEGFMRKIVKKINEQNPDLVLIAGDIIDGPVFDYKHGLSPLRNIQSTFGTVYTPGNHEAYNMEPEKFYPVVKELTKTLIDESVEINSTKIIGLSFKNESFEDTRKRLVKIGFDSVHTSIPTIALLHDPKNTTALLDAGVSLVVSGHTHCGQFFPMTLVVKSIYKEYTYGVHTRNGGTAITTCGAGTAMSPLRLGTNPEIVVIHIK